jgi:cytochrome bd ubiquinol oxidase subunit I
MVLIPVLAIWLLASIPPDSRSWVLGGNVTMTMVMGIGIGASLLIGVYALGAFWYSKFYLNGLTSALLCTIAFAVTAGGEFVRESVRKPYSIRQVLYSNFLRQDELERLRATGSIAADPYPLCDSRYYPNEQLKNGAKVYRFQCSVCHTCDGATGLLDLTGTWTLDQKRMSIAQMQRAKGFMPPFAGTAADLEALVQFLSWRHAGTPREWTASDDPATLAKIQIWLDQVGIRPGIELMGRGDGGESGGQVAPERDEDARGGR